MDSAEYSFSVVSGPDCLGCAQKEGDFFSITLLEQKNSGLALSKYFTKQDKLIFLNDSHKVRNISKTNTHLSFFFSSLFLPYKFLDWEYNPQHDFLGSLRMTAKRPLSNTLSSLSYALWSVCESSLQRFSSDPVLIEALKQSVSSKEYTRFAMLNELYRAIIIKTLAFRLAAPGWTNLLSQRKAYADKPGKLKNALLRILLRPPQYVFSNIPIVYGMEAGHLAFLSRSSLSDTKIV